MNIKSELEKSIQANIILSEKEKTNIINRVRQPSPPSKLQLKPFFISVLFLTIASCFGLSIILPNLYDKNSSNEMQATDIEHSFEEFFHQKMEEMHKDDINYTYSLVHTEFNVSQRDDAIAIFKEQNNHSEEQIYIAYFEKKGHQWDWKRTRGNQWNSSVQWSSMDKFPYIYSGPITNNSIVEVYAGVELAKIIYIENDKRFWYAISSTKDVKVKMVKEDGTEEIIDELNFEKRENK